MQKLVVVMFIAGALGIELRNQLLEGPGGSALEAGRAYEDGTAFQLFELRLFTGEAASEGTVVMPEDLAVHPFLFRAWLRQLGRFEGAEDKLNQVIRARYGDDYQRAELWGGHYDTESTKPLERENSLELQHSWVIGGTAQSAEIEDDPFLQALRKSSP